MTSAELVDWHKKCAEHYAQLADKANTKAINNSGSPYDYEQYVRVSTKCLEIEAFHRQAQETLAALVADAERWRTMCKYHEDPRYGVCLCDSWTGDGGQTEYEPVPADELNARMDDLKNG